MDLTAFFKMSYGLYIVSSAVEGARSGCIVNTVTQITAEPPKACVAIHKENFTTGLIEKSGFFNAVALEREVPMDYIGRFGFQSGRETDKFDGIAFAVDENGLFYPTGYAAAVFGFRVLDKLDVGTHLLFVGEATGARSLSEAPVLTYSEYHAVRRGKTPPKASSYQAEPAAGKTAWRCKVCGYVYEGETIPENYICPVCKKSAEFFDKIAN